MIKKFQYLLLLLIPYLIVPLLMVNLMNMDPKALVANLMLYIPTTLIILNFMFGRNNKIDFMFVLIQILCFIPSLFIFYNSSALIYLVPFFVIGVVAQYVGQLTKRKP